MESFSAIVAVITICLSQAVQSRGLNTVSDCSLEGLISCGEDENCISKEQFCKGVTCPNMKENITCLDVQGSASEISLSTANKTMNMTNNVIKNITEDNKKANMTMGAKKDMAVNEAKVNMTTKESIEAKVDNASKPAVVSKENKITDEANSTMESVTTIEINYDNSTDDPSNTTELSATTEADLIEIAMEETSLTTDGDMLDFNVTEDKIPSNETAGSFYDCNMNDSIACELFDPPCISVMAYCNYSVPCPSQNRNAVCGADNRPLPNRKPKTTNLINYTEPEETNFIYSTKESVSDEHAVKESLKVTESENKGHSHLKIIIPVCVIGGLGLVAIAVWIVTRRNKNVDSYALQ